MATISKFYLHDAATTNTGTMPTGAYLGGNDTTGDATGARTAKSANDVIGVAQTSAVVTATANKLAQFWGFRRFVSAPLAAHTFASADGNWTFSLASSESSLSHNQAIQLVVYLWRPGSGAQVGTQKVVIGALEPTVAGAQQAQSGTALMSGTQAILDGDIIVFEVNDGFTQSASTAFTSTFFYDGTTEASTTNCATFVTPPAALTLFTATSQLISQPSNLSNFGML